MTDEGCTGVGRGRGHAYTEAEVKVLTETASKVAYELGRKDAGEEIAEHFLASAGAPTTGNYAIAQYYAKVAREVSSQPSGAVSDERSGGSA